MVIGAVLVVLGIFYGIISSQAHKKEGQLTIGGVPMIRSLNTCARVAALPLAGLCMAAFSIRGRKQASIKGQLIKQCSEIISQLSSSDGCAGRQSRENLR